jgi:hypothetical protein
MKLPVRLKYGIGTPPDTASLTRTKIGIAMTPASNVSPRDQPRHAKSRISDSGRKKSDTFCAFQVV